ncbi:MAG TPA: DUF4402 domain-containing protein [Candidatus Acidoferrum sp.]|nr:DUF4402 domain-containing protein [Candidatus Acidoferrum sp.]
MKITWLLGFGVALASFLSISHPEQAQAQAIDVTNVSGLAFGNVYPGIPKVIDKTTAGAAAEFHVSGTAGAEVQITFLQLPTYMNQGGFNMHVVISDTDCSMDSSATPNQSSPGYNNLNPWHPIIYRLGLNGLTIWLGGTLVPNIGQKPGNYSGIIQVKAEYTGN